MFATRLRHWSGKLLLGGATLAVSVACVELACRWLEVDFSKGQFDNVPVYYRKPHVPTGEAFLRRDGPTVWSGQVRVSALRLLGVSAEAYADEPSVTVRYDAQGFRNEGTAGAWDVVVVGDSFTELGFLAYEDLFTTRLGARLGLRVKNLGVSYTGTLSQTHYLREYGCHVGARHAVLAFFESNDVDDIARETQALRQARESGIRPVMPTVQSSFVYALLRLPRLLAFVLRPEGKPPRADALYVAGERRIPVTLSDAPPAPGELSEQRRGELREALQDFARAADGCGMRPWLLYLPAKRRVLHDHLEFLEAADARIRGWQPNELPRSVEALCRELGIRFVDPTPALVAAADAGVLPYSPVVDTHVNREGSHIVGDVLAEALREAGEAAR